MTNPPWSDRGPDDSDAGRDNGDSDIDAAFAAIVAGWDLDDEPIRRPARTEETKSPSRPDVAGAEQGADRRAEHGADRRAEHGADRRSDSSADRGRDGAQDPPNAAASGRAPGFAVAPEGWRIHVPPDDDQLAEDAFQPPDPPLPKGAPRFWLAFAGLVVGPLVFIGWALTGPHSTTLPYLLAGLVTLAGFVALVSQLPERHDEGDDGARV